MIEECAILDENFSPRCCENQVFVEIVWTTIRRDGRDGTTIRLMDSRFLSPGLRSSCEFPSRRIVSQLN